MEKLPPIIAKGEIGKKNIFIYGEIHSSIDNEFYEKEFSKFIDKKDTPYFLVEHSTLMPDIEHIDPRLRNQFMKDDGSVIAKGSEWIWYVFNKNKNLLCIDNRLENGFMSSHLERQLDQLDVPTFFFALELTLKACLVVKEKVEKVGGMLKELFINLLETIKQQSMLILQIIKTGKDSEKLHELKDSLIRNMIRISSVSMDVHIVYTLTHDFSRKRKDVHIFVGMCHAIRLAKYFNFDARIDTEYDLNRCMKVD